MANRLPRTAWLAALALTAALATAGAGPAAAAAPSAGALSLSRLIAPPSACPDQTALGAPAGVQLKAMRCMTDFARQRGGLPALASVAALDGAAGHKSADILRCDEFSHEACGREFTFWLQRGGYLDGGCFAAGENIAWGIGPLGSVRHIFKAWIRSEGHRENILSTDFDDLGVGLRIGELEGANRAHVWTEEFGSHDC